MTRRSALQSLAATAALGLTTTRADDKADLTGKNLVPQPDTALYHTTKGRIRQSVVTWCFNPMPVEELAHHSAAMGLQSVELCDPKYWPMLKEAGLTCAIAGSHGFAKGFAHKEEWDECLASLRGRIAECAAAGIGRVITFSGFRRGLSTDEGTANMIAGLRQIAPLAEQKRVTVCLEMLNSRVPITMKGHPDYFCDDMDHTVEICKAVGSERVKVLFDLYHVQIMHGDVISRIKQHAPWIAHVHTAGVPGRGEIDDTQELNYPPLMQALLDIGYKDFVGQEFIPTRPDKIASLQQGVRICDI